jgi:flagellar motor switch protein FliG
MGVYTRFKQKGQEGFRALVQLLETTPMSRRERMIEVGMLEDPAYTELALKFVLKFEDLAQLPDLELAELTAKAPARTTAYALGGCDPAVVERFLRNSKAPVAAEIKDYMQTQIGPREIGGARLKLVEFARQLEQKGLIKSKRIPV